MVNQNSFEMLDTRLELLDYIPLLKKVVNHICEVLCDYHLSFGAVLKSDETRISIIHKPDKYPRNGGPMSKN